MIFDTRKLEHGETRMRRRFAFTPIRIKDKIVWFSFYYQLQGYFYTNYVAIVDSEKKETKGFNVGAWVNLAKTTNKK